MRRRPVVALQAPLKQSEKCLVGGGGVVIEFNGDGPQDGSGEVMGKGNFGFSFGERGGSKCGLGNWGRKGLCN